MDYSYLIWILIIPFTSFLVTGLFSGKIKPQISGWLGTLGLALITLISWYTAATYFAGSAPFEAIVATNMEWLKFTDTLSIHIGILVDPISVMMLVVVSTVSLMVHIYSMGYMKGEPGYSRYYAFLSLFTLSMLGLVVATNLFQMYIFWELVGVSSFLLIGFYYDRPAAVAASKKAFIVTRFADLGFLLGILLLSFHTGTFDFQQLTQPESNIFSSGTAVSFMGLSAITWALILIFIGGAGKSAMFPLHIWLPDAMEGPTPVSALIHAATMVVAGVYLVARLFPLYIFTAPEALEIVAIVGAFTSLFAAVIACTQTDIKRILAFSTMSQIGYMMLALGVSGYAENGLGYMASMFHLFTHAFFKALLFLGAGAIIHAVHSNDMKDMGGLRKKLPVTHITFLLACLAIAGIPPLSGFFSKDEILVAAYQSNSFLFGVEFLVAGLTAFYMFRLYFSVFWGEEKNYSSEPHEASASMLVPMVILAIGAALAGFIPFQKLVTSDGNILDIHLHWNIAIPSVLVGVVGIVVAMVFYRKPADLPDRIMNSMKGFYRMVYHKFYIDEIYLFITHSIIFKYISKPLAWFDRNVVDAAMNGVGWSMTSGSERIKKFQSGQLQQYAAVFLAGAILLIVLIIYM